MSSVSFRTIGGGLPMDTLFALYVLKPSSRERHQHAPLAERPLQI
jgi:hypothetical protein